MEIRNINSGGYFSVEAFYRQQGYSGGINDREQVFVAYVSGKLVPILWFSVGGATSNVFAQLASPAYGGLSGSPD